MKNISMETRNGLLIITVDLSKTFGPSKSGKTTIIATTEGNVVVDGSTQTKMGLNIYRWRDT